MLKQIIKQFNFKNRRFYSSLEKTLIKENDLLFKNNYLFKDSTHNNKRPTYLDYQATTPLDPRVLDTMMPFMIDMYGNPHSRSHSFGWEAEHFVERAREEVANLINAKSKEIIFTSGATESNNLVIKGIAEFYKNKNHIITTQIEHKCVLASCRDVQDKHNWHITYLPVNSEGLINIEELENSITPETALISIIAVNNEIGVIQPLNKIGEICQKHRILFHTDAAQACGKIQIDVIKSNIDLMSISGHKIYGPKGIGALYIKNTKPRIRLHPLISGGGQERGIRSGTLPTSQVVGLGAACNIAKNELIRDQNHVKMLEKRLYNNLIKRLPHINLNGSYEQRYHGNLNLSFEAVEGESLLMSLDKVALSSGSACTSASLEPSYVLRAIGVGEDLAHTSLRFGFGRFTTINEVDECVESVATNVERLRNMSPLWEYRTGESDDKSVKPVWT